MSIRLTCGGSQVRVLYRPPKMNTGQDPSKDRPSPVVIEKLDRRQRKNRRIPGKDHFHLAVLAAAGLSPAGLRCPHAAPYALHGKPASLNLPRPCIDFSGCSGCRAGKEKKSQLPEWKPFMRVSPRFRADPVLSSIATPEKHLTYRAWRCMLCFTEALLSRCNKQIPLSTPQQFVPAGEYLFTVLVCDR